NAAVLGLLGALFGYDSSSGGYSEVTSGWWFAGLGLAHVLAGLALLRLQPRNRVIATCLFGIGLVALNLAFVTLVSGVAIPIGWAAAAGGGGGARAGGHHRAVARARPPVYRVVGPALLLAVGHVLVYDAPLDTLSQGHLSDLWPILAIAARPFLARRTPQPAARVWRAA